MISSYPNVIRHGHYLVEDIFDGVVVIQEKIDGSQISFGVDGDGNLTMRSKNAHIDTDAGGGMFGLAVNWCKENKDRLIRGLTYRGEFLSKPKHNALAYSRIPKNNIILFDIQQQPDESYFDWHSVSVEAEFLGLESVPTFYHGRLEAKDIQQTADECLARESILGGTTIEGIVIKNYSKLGEDRKPLMAKIVRPDFQEVNKKNWRLANPNVSDVLSHIVETYKTDGRWQKAVQHLRDDNRLTGTMRDIPALMTEVRNDTRKECEEEIKQLLFDHYWKKIGAGITSGLPEWYKTRIEETTK